MRRGEACAGTLSGRYSEEKQLWREEIVDSRDFGINQDKWGVMELCPYRDWGIMFLFSILFASRKTGNFGDCIEKIK